MTSPSPGPPPIAVIAEGGAPAPGVESGTVESNAVMAATGAAIVQAGLWGDVWRQLRRSPQFLIGGAFIAVMMVMAIVPQLFTRIDPRDCNLARSRQTPSADAWFGYDVQGCDYYANVIYGARASISVGLLVVGGALVIALVLGSLAGYWSGWVDNIIARVADVLYGLPFILGAIIILYQFDERGVLQVAVALLLLTWMTPMRLVRASVVAVRDSDYVQAARALGATDLRIITRHILPNSLAPVLVYATITIGAVISAEAVLSFLGVGLRLPAISWGLMIGEAQAYVRTTLHLLIFPGIFLVATVLAFIAVGDALRDALDPKLR